MILTYPCQVVFFNSLLVRIPLLSAGNGRRVCPHAGCSNVSSLIRAAVSRGVVCAWSL